VLHRLRKDLTQKAKDDDKRIAAESNGMVKMLTMDLCDGTTKDVCGYTWHEAEWGLMANEFASYIICEYLS